MDLVLIGGGRGPGPEKTVRGLLTQPGPWTSALLVEPGEGDGELAAINRALLLGQQDVLVVGRGVTADLKTAQALGVALASAERIALAVPVVARAAGGRLALQHLPAATELPGADVPCALLSREVLSLIGGLDEQCGSLVEALCDWSLRARQLGFRTVQANRALATSRAPAALPDSPRLQARHSIWKGLRAAYERGFDFQRPHRLLALRRQPLSVCLDLRAAQAGPSGTAVYALRLVENLLQHTPARLTALVANEAQRAQLPEGVPGFLESEPAPEAHLVHRPCQVFSRSEIGWLLRFRGPLIVTYQDLIAYRMPFLFGSAEDHAGYQTLSRLLLRSAQSVVAISEHNRQEMVREFELEPAHVPLVHHGVDAEWFGARSPELNREQLRAAGVRGRYFLAVGADYPHKNHRVLFAAHAQLRASWPGPGPAPELVLVGPATFAPGSGYQELEGRPLPGVRYLGTVPPPLLRALYQQSLGLVYPSVYEGFGLPVLEAMATGVPVICSRHTSLAEVGGDAARYVHPMTDRALAEAMLALARSSGARRAAATRGREHAAGFSWARAAQQTFAAYQRALEAPRPGSYEARRLAAQLLGA